VIDLWYVRTDRAGEPQLLDEYRALLSSDELEQEVRFHFAEGRQQLVVSRALSRCVLGQLADVDPRAWKFARNPFGKPVIAAPNMPELDFNLSHTRGLIVLAVTRGEPIGVDVEDAQRVTPVLDLARRFFAPAEVAALEATVADRQQEMFFRFWTLKEAFLKANGVGLSKPLDQFSLELSPSAPPRISFGGDYVTAPDRWQFAELNLAGQYQVALAAVLAAPLQLTACEVVPLRWQGQARSLPPSGTNRWNL
jgi:4'-phosphopantetheinyl transferase